MNPVAIVKNINHVVILKFPNGLNQSRYVKKVATKSDTAIPSSIEAIENDNNSTSTITIPNHNLMSSSPIFKTRECCCMTVPDNSC